MPNLGATRPNPTNPNGKRLTELDEYLVMAKRTDWAEDFQNWIRAPHNIDKAEMKEEEPEQPESEDEDAEDSDDDDEEEVEEETDEEGSSEEEDG